MSALLARAGWRFLGQHPGQLALSLAGIALGVSVVVGVDLANDSAQRAFELSTDLVTGRATHQLVGLHGSLQDSVYPRLRRELGITRAAPVIEAPVRLPSLPGRSYTMLGLDPLAESPLRDELAPRAQQIDLARLMTVPGTIVLPRPLADLLGAKAGSTFRLIAGGRDHVVEVAGIIEVDSLRREASSAFVFADIATAQELSGLAGRINRIDLVLTAAEAAAVEAWAPPATFLVEASARSRAVVEMSRAFRVNLTALSLLALVVGMFLIYSTLNFLALRRRPLMGTARALGVTPRQLYLVVLTEALVLGAVGTAAGLLLGHLLGAGLTGLVLRTIEDLYFAGAAAVRPDAWVYARGAALGLGATLLAAIVPAFVAAQTPPRALQSRAALERGMSRQLPALAFGAVPIIAIAAWLLNRDTPSLTVAFAGLFCVVAAAAMLMPTLVALLLRVLQVPAGWLGGLPGRLAARSAVASLSRTGVAAAALSVAIATVIGIGVMIESFRGSVADWLDETLQSSFYIRLEQGVFPGTVDMFTADGIEELRGIPGVAGLSLARWLRLPTAQGSLLLRAVEPGPKGWGLRIIEGDAAAARALFLSGSAVVVSESFARRHSIAVGDMLGLPAIDTTLKFPVAGVFRDYSSDRGAVMISLAAYRRHWRDNSLTAIGIYLAPEADALAVRRALDRYVAGAPGLQLGASREIRDASMQIFERTFRITEVLRWLAGLVAFFGVLSSLLALELERVREISVLRAIGFVPAEVRRLVLTQTGLLGLAAGLIAIPLGIVLASLLVHVINERAFGWTMTFTIPPGTLLGGLAMALIAALLAGLVPAWRLARHPLASALREE